SGYPMTASSSNSFQPICADPTASCPSPANPAIAYGPTSGDYNADGESGAGLDYPNAVSYRQRSGNQAWLTGAIPKSDFAVPTFGQEGNERYNAFRGPNFIETNVNFYKDTRITERVMFELRFEFFNLFNRPNYAGVDRNFVDTNFSDAVSSHEPRFWQLGGKISF
ncbi:MAG: carboxypeptidase regulatory-like domain-containing protein, partial [Acidobacteria bacterium]|nr:carboxypeptidase regulatory-like domain-containing protein [Acidobacteriota bacterium]